MGYVSPAVFQPELFESQRPEDLVKPTIKSSGKVTINESVTQNA